MTSKTEAAKTGSQHRAANPFGWRTVTPLVMGSALNPVNSSVIATALVPIAAALHVPVGRTSILVSSLYLACAIAQPTAGKLAEEFGPPPGLPRRDRGSAGRRPGRRPGQ